MESIFAAIKDINDKGAFATQIHSLIHVISYDEGVTRCGYHIT